MPASEWTVSLRFDARRVQHLPAAEREQLPRQRLTRGSPRRGSRAAFRDAASFCGYLLGDERAEADNRREDVVEVVRDPAGQLADRLHLLRLVELALEPLAVGKHRGELRLAFAQRFRHAARLRSPSTGMPAKPFPLRSAPRCTRVPCAASSDAMRARVSASASTMRRRMGSGRSAPWTLYSAAAGRPRRQR